MTLREIFILLREVAVLLLISQLIVVVQGIVSFAKTQALVGAAVNDYSSKAGLESGNSCHCAALTREGTNSLQSDGLELLLLALSFRDVLRAFSEVPNVHYAIF